jgi:hypothetical protein
MKEIITLTPEQTLRLDILRLLISSGVSADDILKQAIPLLEWTLGSHHLQPCSTDDKE